MGDGGGPVRLRERTRGLGLRIGSVAGIPIELHPSWFFVFALVTWSLAAGHFPSASPGWTPLAYWLVGAATGLLFFASVLVHELGHSLVALRAGIPIRGITLFIFGGVARIAREPSSPGVELRVAAAGPLTSFLLGGLCLLGRSLATGMPMLEASIDQLSAMGRRSMRMPSGTRTL